jgi:carbon storage regulator CsrA
MLVLTRKPGEEIILPDQGVTIRLTEVCGNRASIGVTAPDHIRILRRELWNREPQPTSGEQPPLAAANP